MARYDDLSREDLIRLLQARDRRDATRFGLVWETNEIERDQAINGDFVALDHDPALSHGEGPWRNLIIEGDNFDALRALKLGFAGRVKCIYIDPPYNTGNKDFVYNDRFVDKEHSWRHSLWCEFMFRRLELAKELLAPDGVIFVSIDDNEVFHLGLLMNRVFGEQNFLANVIWQKVFAPKNTARHFSDDHEYVMVFAFQADLYSPNLVNRSEAAESRYKNPDNDHRGPWTSGDIQARNSYSEGIYPITCPSGRIIAGPGAGMYWRYSKRKFDELNADNRIWWGKDGNNMPRVKRFRSEVSAGQVPQTLWRHDEVGNTQEAKRDLIGALGITQAGEVFSTPKPVRLLERILQIATGPNDLVLDFFAGSGTTAHAVAKLNAADGGNRRFILVSSTEATVDGPEKNICRDVCAERVRRVMKGYGETAGLGGDFAYLRCRRIPAGELIDIAHDQVWTALQLLHTDTLEPYAAKALHWRADEDGCLAYVPRLKSGTAKELIKRAKDLPGGLVYSWQSGVLRHRLSAEAPHLEVAAIPQALSQRFGLREGGARE